MTFLLIAAISFLGVVTQSVIGFGVALICMPLLVQIIDPATAAAYVAIFTLPLQLIILWRYRHALQVRPFWRVILGTAVGAPIGVLLIEELDQRVVLSALGVLLIGYALYSLFRLRLPKLHHRVWEYGFGMASGALSGAYNTGGPPLVIYGTSLGWKPEQFKANLQALFMLNSVLVIGAHAAAGHIDTFVMENVLISLPITLIGSAAGFWLSRYVDEETFRKAVLILLIVIGVRLLLS